MSEPSSNIKVICLESPAFQALVNEITTELQEKYFNAQKPWVNEKETMSLLGIIPKTAFQKYWDEGNMEHSVISGKHYLYKRTSILSFIEYRTNQ